ncbi:ATP-binding protein [Noviherbaspirillum sp. ST9]|uniref:ATP-binding protein n=1 Tax=Noviherbaspirillum sp. ST9 TaxID=3401606 RepID=UPI003B58B1E0
MSGTPTKMTRRVRFTMPAELDNVSATAEALRAFMSRSLPEEACNAIELGIVEALTNIVMHGYGGLEPGAVELSFEQSADAAIVEIIDAGRPIPMPALGSAGLGKFDFDPADISQLPEGGMGLSIIRTVFDAVQYESSDGVNRLTLAKRFGAPEVEIG